MSYSESVDFGSRHLGNSGTIYVRSVPSGVVIGICIDANGDLDIAFDATEAGKLVDALHKCQPNLDAESSGLCCWDHESEGTVRITIRRANDQVELCFVHEQEPDYVWRTPFGKQGIELLERALKSSLNRTS